MKTRSILAALMVAALLVPACTKHRIPATWGEGESQNHGGNNPGGNGGQNPGGNENTGGNGGQQGGLTLNLREDWSIVYDGRIEDYVEADGSLSDVEQFTVSCPGAEFFEVRIISQKDYENIYDSDLKKYLEEEEGYIAQDMESLNCSVSELNYVYSPATTNTILFDRSRSDEFQYILIGLKANGKLSGDYTQRTVVFEQEVATAEYKKWLGEWLVLDADCEVGYNIVISQSEANWLYRIDGWEMGKSICTGDGSQMDQEYIETRFDRATGKMVFFSQYLGGYPDDQWGWLDEYFLGNISDTQGVQGIIDPIGLNIAYADFADGTTSVASIVPEDVWIPVDNRSVKMTYTSMSYWNVDSESNNPQWFRYNTNNPEFVMSMTRTKSTGMVAIAPEREVNGRTIHCSQPRSRRIGDSNIVRCSVTSTR